MIADRADREIDRPGPKEDPITSPVVLFNGDAFWAQVVNALLTGRLEWPALDEGAVKQFGQWIRFLRRTIDAAGAAADRLRTDLAKIWPAGGESIAAATRALAHLSERLRAASAQAEELSTGITRKAGETQYEKLSMEITAYITIVQCVVMVITAILSGPAGGMISTSLAAVIGSGQTRVATSLARLAAAMARPVGVVFRATTSLERVAGMTPGVGRVLESHALRGVMLRESIEGTTEAVIVDLGAKFGQYVSGNGEYVDWGLTGRALIQGVLEGPLGVPAAMGVAAAIRPLTTAATRAVYAPLRRLNVPNLTLPPMAGGLTKFAADWLARMPAIALTTAVPSALTGEFYRLIDHGFDVSAYLRTFDGGQFGESLIGGGLAGIGRGGTGLLETSHAAYAMLDLATNGPGKHELALVAAIEHDQGALAAFGDLNLNINVATLRHLATYHGDFDPVENLIHAGAGPDVRLAANQSAAHPVAMPVATPVEMPVDMPVDIDGLRQVAERMRTIVDTHAFELTEALGGNLPESVVTTIQACGERADNLLAATSTGDLSAAARAMGLPPSPDGQLAAPTVADTVGFALAEREALNTAADIEAFPAEPLPPATPASDANPSPVTIEPTGFSGTTEFTGTTVFTGTTGFPELSGVSPTTAAELVPLLESQRNWVTEQQQTEVNAGRERLDQLCQRVRDVADQADVGRRTKASEWVTAAKARMTEESTDSIDAIARAEEEIIGILREVARMCRVSARADGRAAVVLAEREQASSVAFATELAAFSETLDRTTEAAAKCANETSTDTRSPTSPAPVDNTESRATARTEAARLAEAFVTHVYNRAIVADTAPPRIPAAVREELAEASRDYQLAVRECVDRTRAYRAAKENLAAEREFQADRASRPIVAVLDDPELSRRHLAEAEADFDRVRADTSRVYDRASASWWTLRDLVEAAQRAGAVPIADLLRAGGAAIGRERFTLALRARENFRTGVDRPSASRQSVVIPAPSPVFPLPASNKADRNSLGWSTRRRYPGTYRPVGHDEPPAPTLRAAVKPRRSWRSGWWLPLRLVPGITRWLPDRIAARTLNRVRRLLTKSDLRALDEFRWLAQRHREASVRLAEAAVQDGFVPLRFAAETRLWVSPAARADWEQMRALEKRLAELITGADFGTDRGFATLDGLPGAEFRRRLIGTWLAAINQVEYGADGEIRTSYARAILDHFSAIDNAPRPALARLRKGMLAAKFERVRVLPTDNEAPILRNHLTWHQARVPEQVTVESFNDVFLVQQRQRWGFRRGPAISFAAPGFTVAIVPRAVAEIEREIVAGIDVGIDLRGIDLPSGGRVMLPHLVQATQFLAVVPDDVDADTALTEVTEAIERIAGWWRSGMPDAARHTMRHTVPALGTAVGTLIPSMLTGQWSTALLLGRQAAAALRGSVGAALAYSFDRDAVQAEQLWSRQLAQVRGVQQVVGVRAEMIAERDQVSGFLLRHGAQLPPEVPFEPLRELTEPQWEELLDRVHSLVATTELDQNIMDAIQTWTSHSLDFEYDGDRRILAVHITEEDGKRPASLDVEFIRGRTKSYRIFSGVRFIDRRSHHSVLVDPALIDADDQTIVESVAEAASTAINVRLRMFSQWPKWSVAMRQHLSTALPAAAAEYAVAYPLLGAATASGLASGAVVGALLAGAQTNIDRFYDSTRHILAGAARIGDQTWATSIDQIAPSLEAHRRLVTEAFPAVRELHDRARAHAGLPPMPVPALSVSPAGMSRAAESLFSRLGATCTPLDAESGETVGIRIDFGIASVPTTEMEFHEYPAERPNTLKLRRTWGAATAVGRKSGKPSIRFRVHMSRDWDGLATVAAELLRIRRRVVGSESMITPRPTIEFVRNSATDVGITIASAPLLLLVGNNAALASEVYRLVESSLSGMADSFANHRQFQLNSKFHGAYFDAADHDRHPTRTELQDDVNDLDKRSERAIERALSVSGEIIAGTVGSPAQRAELRALGEGLVQRWARTHDEIVMGMRPQLTPDGPFARIPGVLRVDATSGEQADGMFRILLGRTDSYAKSVLTGQHPLLVRVRLVSQRGGPPVSLWSQRDGLDISIGVTSTVAATGYREVHELIADYLSYVAKISNGMPPPGDYLANAAREQVATFGNRVGVGVGAGRNVLTDLAETAPMFGAHSIAHAFSSRWHALGARNTDDINEMWWNRLGFFVDAADLQREQARFIAIIEDLDRAERMLDLVEEITGRRP